MDFIGVGGVLNTLESQHQAFIHLAPSISHCSGLSKERREITQLLGGQGQSLASGFTALGLCWPVKGVWPRVAVAFSHQHVIGSPGKHASRWWAGDPPSVGQVGGIADSRSRWPSRPRGPSALERRHPHSKCLHCRVAAGSLFHFSAFVTFCYCSFFLMTP